MAQEQTKQERFDALQQQLRKAWDRVARHEAQLLLARRQTERLLIQKADLLREED
jgi:hypothetical protein